MIISSLATPKQLLDICFTCIGKLYTILIVVAQTAFSIQMHPLTSATTVSLTSPSLDIQRLLKVFPSEFEFFAMAFIIQSPVWLKTGLLTLVILKRKNIKYGR